MITYWGTTAEAATADLYSVTYDYTADPPEKFTLLSSATVTAK